MFSVTPVHIAAFRQYRRDRFIEELALGSMDFLPEGLPFLTLSDRLSGARFVYDRAEAAGYETRGAFFFWLNLAAVFGACFSTDPQYERLLPSAANANGGHELADLNKVYRHVSDYATTVFGGQQNTLYNNALRAFLDELKRPDQSCEAGIVAILERLYPAKVAAHRPVFLRKARAMDYHEKSRRLLGSDRPNAAFAIAALEMFFGQGFENDPLKPWIGKELEACRAHSLHDTVDFNPLAKRIAGWLDFEQER